MGSAITAIREKLQRYPNLKVEQSEKYIRVLPSESGGFPVTLFERQEGATTVYYADWHEDFDREEEAHALNCFAMGLSDFARLKVASAGDVDYKWTLETRQGDKWISHGMVGLLFFPFWRRRRDRYLQNRIITESFSECSACGNVYSGANPQEADSAYRRHALEAHDKR